MTEKFVFEHATDNRYYVRDANGAVQPLKPEAVADFLQEAAHCATAHDPAKECPNFCCVLAAFKPSIDFCHCCFIVRKRFYSKNCGSSKGCSDCHERNLQFVNCSAQTTNLCFNCFNHCRSLVSSRNQYFYRTSS